MAQPQSIYARFGEASSGRAPISGSTQAAQQISTGTTVTNRRDKHKTMLFVLGIVECAVAVILIALAITTLSMTVGYDGSYRYTYGSGVYMTYPAQGLWGGLLVAVTGILGVCTKRNPSVCMYNANMAMSIVTASILPAALILSGFASASGFAVSFHIFITIFLFAAVVICIVHSAYCCAGVCCRSKQQYQAVVVYVPQQNQQVVRLANGQYAVPVGNTVMPQQYGYVMAASAQIPTAVNYQPPEAGAFAQQTVLPPQGTIAQPATPNSPCTRNYSYGNSTMNEAAENPPKYSALPKN